MFLNEKGGGVVSRVISDEIVHVSIEDGFEIPYAVGDLIRASRVSEEGGQPAIYYSAAIRSPNARESPLRILAHQGDVLPVGLYLAMVPRNQDQVLASALDLYLLNHTEYKLAFALFLNKSGHFRGHSWERLGSSEKFHLGKVERSEIEDWNHSLFQALFFQDGKTGVVPPLSTHIVFKPVKIYKEDSFAFSAALHQKALTVAIHTLE